MSAGKPAPPVWTTAAEIEAQLQRLWDDGRLLSARITGEALDSPLESPLFPPLFPLELRLRQPSVAAMGAQFDAVRQ